ncbi:CotH kinase family protein [Flavobacterium sp. N3904]|uniref:CotH kinase family protein n=1 Tax=Flavobacterium sp. N3904 TaxID=2986835 RepID=UPI0022245A08|nr:CotH kinase family protein [Flavobacterium sp. N3904]
MKKKYFLNANLVSKIFLVFVLIISVNANSQTFTDSNLPIVLITTDTDPNTGQPLEILDDPRILASMKIIKHPDGSRNYLTDSNSAAYLNYNGRINIEIRGSSSQTLPKKPYGLTTLKSDNISNNNVSLLGMPSENDWILNSLAFDPSLIRDYLSYNLSNNMGDYASRTAYCEVVINSVYAGLYLLQEKIKSNSSRVNVLKIGTSDIAFPNVTGGYITKTDKTTGGDPIAWTMSSYHENASFIHELPKPASVTSDQNTYIHDQFLKLETTASDSDPNLITGYPSVIDVPSFVDFMLINELASNVDAYQYSTYYHKDKGGKLRAGPIWDFNLTYGNDLFQWGFDRSKTNVWQFSNGDNEGAKFWTDLFNNTTYKCYMAKRWNDLIQSGHPFNETQISNFIDQTVNYISEATIRENQRWSTIPNHAQEIIGIKSFISSRISWMNTNLGSFSGCNSVVKPALVISKINYNPSISTSFPISNDLEFIEITNMENTTVDLTGVYFKELGLTYQFPANSQILANSSIYLTSNMTSFNAKYDQTAFGQFTRNLSNSSQKIVLADGFGNTIDTVEYFDAAPWATQADGNGSYLKLIDTALDNNLASSWVAISDATLSTSSFEVSNSLSVYPNPVTNVLNIESKKPIIGIKVFNILGTLINEKKGNSEIKNYDLTNYSSGVYFITLYNDEGFVTKKIIKK